MVITYICENESHMFNWKYCCILIFGCGFYIEQIYWNKTKIVKGKLNFESGIKKIFKVKLKN